MIIKVLKMFVDALVLPAVGIVFCLVLWTCLSLLTTNPKTNKAEFPSPIETWKESKQYFVAPFTNNEEEGFRGIGLETLDSLKLVAEGYLLALLFAVPIGFLLGSSKVFARMFDPVFQLLRPVSPLAWFPLAGLVVMAVKRSVEASLGKGIKIDAIEWQCLFTIAICAVWPTIMNTAVGVRAIPQDYLNVARVLRLGAWKRFIKIQLPATLPYMFTGFRLSLGIAWLVIVAAEMLAGKAGVGYFLWNSYNGGNYGAMIASIIVIGVVGFILDRIMTILEKNVYRIAALPRYIGLVWEKIRPSKPVAVTEEVSHVAA